MESIKACMTDVEKLSLKDIKNHIETLEMCFGSQAEVDHMLVCDGYTYVLVQQDVE